MDVSGVTRPELSALCSKRCKKKAKHRVNESTYSLPDPLPERETSVYNTEARAIHRDDIALTCAPSALPTGTILEQLRP